MKVKVEFVGKKKNFVYENTFKNEFVRLEFKSPGDTAIISKTALDNILKHNPYGFLKVIDGPIEEAPAEEVAEKKESFICPTCFKEYSDQRWYDKHVKMCMAPVDEPDEIISDDGSPMDAA
jgi:hypothetical protein